MYFSLIVTLLMLLAIAITGIQNSMPVDLKFIAWSHQMSLTALIFFSSLFGGAVVAVLALPKLVRKFLDVRSSNREIHKLKEMIAGLGKGHSGGSQAG